MEKEQLRAWRNDPITQEIFKSVSDTVAALKSAPIVPIHLNNNPLQSDDIALRATHREGFLEGVQCLSNAYDLFDTILEERK